MKERPKPKITVVGKINPDLIPDYEWDICSSVLDDCVRRLFQQPGIQEEYEEWLAAQKKEACHA